MVEYARPQGLGISTFVSMGNKAGVSGNDLLRSWEQDGATDVIGLYLESFGNPCRFMRITRRVGRTEPALDGEGGAHGGGRPGRRPPHGRAHVQ